LLLFKAGFDRPPSWANLLQEVEKGSVMLRVLQMAHLMGNVRLGGRLQMGGHGNFPRGRWRRMRRAG